MTFLNHQPSILNKIKRGGEIPIFHILFRLVFLPYESRVGVWSSGMILASGARGREFDSRNTPSSFL